MLSRLVFLGPPGAGKGTQAVIASGKLGIPAIGTGAIFREAIAQGSVLGKEISQFVNSGLLVPDKLTNAIVVERLKKADFAKGFILDGYPRTIVQTQALDVYLSKKNRSLERVLFFKVEPSVVVERMGQRRVCSKCETNYNLVTQPSKTPGVCDHCGGELITRIDDSPDHIRKRLEVYQESTSPLLNYFDQQGILRVVNASMPVDHMAGQVAAFMNESA